VVLRRAPRRSFGVASALAVLLSSLVLIAGCAAGPGGRTGGDAMRATPPEPEPWAILVRAPMGYVDLSRTDAELAAELAAYLHAQLDHCPAIRITHPAKGADVEVAFDHLCVDDGLMIQGRVRASFSTEGEQRSIRLELDRFTVDGVETSGSAVISTIDGATLRFEQKRMSLHTNPPSRRESDLPLASRAGGSSPLWSSPIGLFLRNPAAFVLMAAVAGTRDAR
jgi:hypothetical protein